MDVNLTDYVLMARLCISGTVEITFDVFVKMRRCTFWCPIHRQQGY